MKLRNLFAMLIIIMLFIGGNCIGQPTTVHDVNFTPGANADVFLVFVWEGSDPATCPLIDDMDYKSVEALKIGQVLGSPANVELQNNGEFVVVGIVSYASQSETYANMGVSSVYTKPTIPGKTLAIVIPTLPAVP